MLTQRREDAKEVEILYHEEHEDIFREKFVRFVSYVVQNLCLSVFICGFTIKQNA